MYLDDSIGEAGVGHVNTGLVGKDEGFVPLVQDDRADLLRSVPRGCHWA